MGGVRGWLLLVVCPFEPAFLFVLLTSPFSVPTQTAAGRWGGARRPPTPSRARTGVACSTKVLRPWPRPTLYKGRPHRRRRGRRPPSRCPLCWRRCCAACPSRSSERSCRGPCAPWGRTPGWGGCCSISGDTCSVVFRRARTMVVGRLIVCGKGMIFLCDSRPPSLSTLQTAP